MILIFKIEQDFRIYELLEILGVRELIPFDSAEIDLFTFPNNVRLDNVAHQVSVEMKGDSITATAGDAFFTNNFC